MDDYVADIEEFRTHLFDLEGEMSICKELQTSKVIDLLKTFSNFHHIVDMESSRLKWSEYCSIMTNILTFWAHSNASVSQEQLKFLAKYKSILSSIFLSGHDTHQRALLRCFKPQNNYKQNFTKVLLIISINNLNQLLFRGYQAAGASEALILSVGWLSERTQMTRQASIYHQKLVDDFHRFDHLLIDLDFIPLLSKSYMYTTYSNSVGKDKIKATIHKLISRAIHATSEKRALEFNRMKIRKKPKIMIIHEYFCDTHVMMRCFLPILSELDEELDITHLTWSKDSFSEAARRLKRVITCSDNLSSIIATIKREEPDVILYPSVGMHTFVISLASLRLAPIQLQLFGHPSSSNSSSIDGSLHNNNLGFLNSGPEKFASYEGYRQGIHMPITLKEMENKIWNTPLSNKTGKFNIAINAKVMKLCPDFMLFLRTIDWPAKNIQLNFFPAESGTDYLACANGIHRYFPTANVHHMSDYESFMHEMAIQDLAICAFPFGNTNGILDCLYLGLPTFVLKGREICSASESQLLLACGLQNFIFPNKKKLGEAVTKFLSDECWREDVRGVFKSNSELNIENNDISAAQRYEACNMIEWIRDCIQQHCDKHLQSTFQINTPQKAAVVSVSIT